MIFKGATTLGQEGRGKGLKEDEPLCRSRKIIATSYARKSTKRESLSRSMMPFGACRAPRDNREGEKEDGAQNEHNVIEERE